MRRPILSLFVLAGLVLLPSACWEKREGAVRVTVIGGAAKIRDPALTALSAPDAVLIANVG